MSTLAIETVDLISTIRKAPLNGAPSSRDYNDSETEKLADIAAISMIINDVFLPILNALPSTAATGLEGRTLFADTSDHSSLFLDPLTSQPLTVSDCLRLLNGILTNFRTTLSDINLEVIELQKKLSSTNQNDLALALQNLTNTINSVSGTQTTQTNQIKQLQSISNKSATARVPFGTISPGQTLSLPVNWLTPFLDNNYTVSLAIENPFISIFLWGFHFSDIPGQGIVLTLGNTSQFYEASGTIHATAIHD